jgi:NAD(P)H dehydrogenase (quinone)
MSRIVVLYYSRTGNTEQMARAVAEGARKAGAEVEVATTEGFNVERLREFDGIIVGSPVYYGTMAAEVKKLIDESVRFHGALKGKVGGAFSSSANLAGGNETTIMDILQALLIHGMVIQGTHNGDHYGPVALGAPDARALRGCRQLGARVADLTSALAGKEFLHC